MYIWECAWDRRQRLQRRRRWSCRGTQLWCSATGWTCRWWGNLNLSIDCLKIHLLIRSFIHLSIHLSNPPVADQNCNEEGMQCFFLLHLSTHLFIHSFVHLFKYRSSPLLWPDVVAVKVGGHSCLVLCEESLLLVESSDGGRSLHRQTRIIWNGFNGTPRSCLYLDTLSEVWEDRRLSDWLKTFHLTSCSGEVDWDIKTGYYPTWGILCNFHTPWRKK